MEGLPRLTAVGTVVVEVDTVEVMETHQEGNPLGGKLSIFHKTSHYRSAGSFC